MSDGVQFWQFFAGLGLFLLGMAQLEEGLSGLAGRSLKRFLRQHTGTPIKALSVGIVATALLQSSSVVGLMVLAFVGARIITMRNGLGVVFGSNLGTTFTGWVVTLLGFKLQLDGLALPLIAMGSIALVSATPGKRLAYYARLGLGLGFLLFGLGFMKGSVESVAGAFDVARLAGQPLIVFLLAGALFTAVIQSSSATMIITLSALNAGVLELPQAAAVVIGADLGTTSTVLLGALKGSVAKRQVAMAHFLFNLVTDILAFVLLSLLLWVISDVLRVTDPLYSLVLFHSGFNLLGILLFVPVLGPFARFLEQVLRAGEDRAAAYLDDIPANVPDAAIEGLAQETRHLISQAIAINLKAFDLSSPRTHADRQVSTHPVWREDDYARRYEALKQLEGEILAFAIAVQKQKLDEDDSARLTQLLTAVRSAVHSAKCVKDMRADLRQFRESASDYAVGFYDSFRATLRVFYDRLIPLRDLMVPGVLFEELVTLLRENQDQHDRFHRKIYQEESLGHVNEVELSTLLNMNREFYSSNKRIVFAVKDCFLEPGRAEDFSNLPGMA